MIPRAIKIKGYMEENLQDYRKASFFLAFPSCTFKCCIEQGLDINTCQNHELAEEEIKGIELERIWNLYIENDLTEAFVLGGLEPLDSFYEVLSFISYIRNIKCCDDDIVIYTGYKEEEIQDDLYFLKQYENIYVKFGRYVPNQEPHYDEVLGVNLISDNQYGKKIS